MNKGTDVDSTARSSQIMVVAKLLVTSSSLDVFHCRETDSDSRIEATSPGAPSWLRRVWRFTDRLWLVLLGRQGHGKLRRWGSALCDLGPRIIW
jgi:hypothetical protein